MILNDVHAKIKPTITGLSDCSFDQLRRRRRQEHPFNYNNNNNQITIHQLTISKFELEREKR